MPVYEYYCRTCHATFEKLRPIRDAEAAAACPAGHDGAQRTISMFAMLSRRESESEGAGAFGGGCACGGACACGGGISRN